MITITLQTFNYFLSLDMPVMELLGSSETGGPQTACLKVKTYSLKHLFIEVKSIIEQIHPSLNSSITFTFTDLQGPGMRQGSVGKSYPHFETTILNPDQKYWLISKGCWHISPLTFLHLVFPQRSWWNLHKRKERFSWLPLGRGEDQRSHRLWGNLFILINDNQW